MDEPRHNLTDSPPKPPLHQASSIITVSSSRGIAFLSDITSPLAAMQPALVRSFETPLLNEKLSHLDEINSKPCGTVEFWSSGTAKV